MSVIEKHTCTDGRALKAASSWGPRGFSMSWLTTLLGTGSGCADEMMLA